MTSTVARLQTLQGNTVSNSRHQQIKLDDLERHLVTVLDGQRDNNGLVDSLRCAFAKGLAITVNGQNLVELPDKKLSQLIENALVRLRDAGLLVGPAGSLIHPGHPERSEGSCS
jgi:hypothetical protein